LRADSRDLNKVCSGYRRARLAIARIAKDGTAFIHDPEAQFLDVKSARSACNPRILRATPRKLGFGVREAAGFGL
jgi:hypothetical protein